MVPPTAASFIFCLCFVYVSSFKILKPVATEQAAEQLTQAVNLFTIDLFQRTVSEENANIVLCPFSVSLLLTAMIVGARGTTAQQINKTLNYKDMSLEDVATAFHDIFVEEISMGYQLHIYKAMLYREKNKINPNFGEIVGILLMVEGQAVEFENSSSADLVNDYVQNGTRGMITKFFNETLDPATEFLLVSATHFRGVWHTRFDKQKTQLLPFNSSGNTEPKMVPMMNMVNTFQYIDDDTLQAEILQIPYKEEEGDMILVLPRNKNGLQALERDLTIELLENAIESTSKIEVNLTLAKFNVTNSFALKPLLQNMGIKRAFQRNRADFFGVVGIDGMSITNVHQKNTIEVTEEGMAASSGGIVRPRRAQSEQIQFTVDRPFLYFVRDRRTNIIFFIGHVIEL